MSSIRRTCEGCKRETCRLCRPSQHFLNTSMALLSIGKARFWDHSCISGERVITLGGSTLMGQRSIPTRLLKVRYERRTVCPEACSRSQQTEAPRERESYGHP